MGKVIILDVDGVVADFASALLDHNPARKALGVNSITNYRIDFTREEYRACGNPKFWRDLPPYPDANPLAFMQHGHTIVWCTKPWESCKEWAYQRTNWIRRHYGDGEIVCTAAKHRVRGDVLIEDSYDNLVKWKAHFPEGRALLCTRPWNESVHYQDRFAWSDLPKLLEELA